MVIAGFLILAALGLWWVIVPLIHRFGLNVTSPGGLIACVSAGTAGALLVGGLVALLNALSRG